MNLSCKACGRQIPAHDINIDRLIAKCEGCNTVFSFADDVDGARRRSPSGARPGADAARLCGRRHGHGLRIVRRWWSPVYLFLAFFCVFWCGFLFFWYGMAFAGDAPLIFFLFPLLHVAVGVGLSYFTLAGFLNRTVIEVDGQSLSVRHTPLPWTGNRKYSSPDIKQLYVQERRKSGENNVRYSYDLLAVDRFGDQLKVLKGLTEPHQALYLEQVIQKRLGIEDYEIPGQFKG